MNIQTDEDSRKFIYTNEISDYVGIRHKHLLGAIRKKGSDWNVNTEHSFFLSSIYLNSRGRRYENYKVFEEGVSLLTSLRMLTAGVKGARFSEILDLFGKKVKVVVDCTTRHEDRFYSMLSRFLPDITIVRQFSVSGFRIDFYIPELYLFIEYDEEQHFTEISKSHDHDRWIKVKEHMQSQDEKATPLLVRVRKGKEIEGLSAISRVEHIDFPFSDNEMKDNSFCAY